VARCLGTPYTRVLATADLAIGSTSERRPPAQ